MVQDVAQEIKNQTDIPFICLLELFYDFPDIRTNPHP